MSAGRPITLRRVLALPLIWPIRFYQLVISPMTPPSCRFYPCCSSYAVTALERFGPVRGGWLTVRRLARCHPWNPGGVDHVPPREVREPDVPAWDVSERDVSGRGVTENGPTATGPTDVTARGARVHHQ